MMPSVNHTPTQNTPVDEHRVESWKTSVTVAMTRVTIAPATPSGER